MVAALGAAVGRVFGRHLVSGMFGLLGRRFRLRFGPRPFGMPGMALMGLLRLTGPVLGMAGILGDCGGVQAQCKHCTQDEPGIGYHLHCFLFP
jgi:hypothetical protein